MVLLVYRVFPILGFVIELAHAGGRGVGEVVNYLLCCFLVCQFQIGLSCCKGDDKLPVYSSPLYSDHIQLLHLGQAGTDPLVADDPFHLGS